MAFLEINRRYQALCRRLGLVAAEDFLQLPAVIVSGHPDRHVARVTLGEGAGAVRGYLKREHYVRRKERLRNALDGFGFVSKSAREATVLRCAADAGVACPEWIAAGEDRSGRAFLLVREETARVDLRALLCSWRSAPMRQRRDLAERLGKILAQVHGAGLTHPDLHAKHILVSRDGGTFCILDWQRSRRQRRITWAQCGRNLAALAATIPEDWVGPGERLACLRAYLRARSGGASHKPETQAKGGSPSLALGAYPQEGERRAMRRRMKSMARSILQLADRLLRRRRIREQRRPPLAGDVQHLVWLDGEALCISLDLHASLRGWLPEWLVLDNLPAWPPRLELRETVATPLAPQALLVRRRENRFLARARAWLRGRAFTAPELRQAGLVFRLQRYGIRTPRLLAFGQRLGPLGRVESFLLMEQLSGAVNLADWLRVHGRLPSGSARLARHRRLILEAGRLLRDLHEAQCALRDPMHLQVWEPPGEPPTVVLRGPEGLRPLSRHDERTALADMQLLYRALAAYLSSRTDGLRFLRAYFGVGKLTLAAKDLARSVAAPRGPVGLVHRARRAGRWTRRKVKT
jgi:tRNA A-37 threonylcarbamoyl transferase component Bud32